MKVNGKTVTQAVSDLNDATSMLYSISRVREWCNKSNARGRKMMPEVRKYMLKRVLVSVVGDVDFNSITTRKISAIAEKLK